MSHTHYYMLTKIDNRICWTRQNYVTFTSTSIGDGRLLSDPSLNFGLQSKSEHDRQIESSTFRFTFFLNLLLSTFSQIIQRILSALSIVSDLDPVYIPILDNEFFMQEIICVKVSYNTSQKS